MLVSFNWLKEFVDIEISPRELADKITMGGVEVEEVVDTHGDSILNLAPTPNRGDCLSIIGVARETAALLGRRVKLPKFHPPKGKGKMSGWVEVIVGSKKDAPRYTSRVVDKVKVGPSPEWLRKRVESVGLRSINNVVDATNYVLMEMGQPVHAFDLRFLRGSKLIIDRPKSECKLVALDGVEYKFTKEDILNLDGKGPVGAAGIMGGENSGVVDDTVTLVLESAYFNPISVRRTSKRTGLVSESSRRFEKGVDAKAVILALHHLTELIIKVAGGTPSADWVDFYPDPFETKKIELTAEKVNWLLGTKIDSATIRKVLNLIGCEVRAMSGDKMMVTVPLYRPDLGRPVDLIEEVARLYGYDKINPSMPTVRVSSIVKPPANDAVLKARDVLVSLGFFEALTYSFASERQSEQFGSGEAAVELTNPLTSDMVYLRQSLIPELLRSLENNLNRQILNVRLFELNKTFFSRGKGLPLEKVNMAGVMTGEYMPCQWEGKGRMIDIYDAKAALSAVFERLGLDLPDVETIKDRDFLHPVDSFDVLFKGKSIGFCGRLHPHLEKEYDFGAAVYIFELDFDTLVDAYLARKIVYKPVSRYPIVQRDVALLVDSGVTHKEMLQSFNNNLNKLVQTVELFDIYSGQGIPSGKKSMAYRISFGSSDRTLSDEEVDAAFKGIVEAVKKEKAAEIR